MPETDKWEFKLGEAKTCWKDLSTFSAAECAADVAVTDATALPATLDVATFQGGFYLAECTGTTFTVQPGDTETLAKAATADAVKVTYDSTAGVVGCTGWNAEGVTPTKWFKMTAAGWAEKSADADAETSGAMSLASAVAAGALAVAATQF